MKIIGTQELKDIQLEILLAVHKYCVENNIKYSLACGTLLGAIRHKGFIPWDDDIDICLLRDEYVKLESVFPQLIDGKYKFVTLNRDKEWKRPWGKICDIRTEVKEDIAPEEKNLGIGIDVFPMDDVPDDKGVFSKWNFIRKLMISAWTAKRLKWRKGRKFIKNIIALFAKILLLPFSLRLLSKLIDSYIQNVNGKGYSHVFESCDSLKAKNSQLKSNFANYINIEFEGYVLKAAEGYDDYLRNIYGDYMILPPVENRMTHHALNAYWKE